MVGLITPWNFPLAIPAWKIAPALAYGNCVVFKPADLVPGCAWAIADILKRAGVPDGVFNLVMGRGSVVGEALLDSPDVAAISFTGSVETGRHVAQEVCRAARQVPARDGRQEPADRARRRRPRDRRQLRGQRRLFLDRPALHGVLAPDRDRADPRPVRGRDGRAPEGAQGRPCAQARHRDRPGGRPEPARAGPLLPRDRPEGRGEARGRRPAPEARDRGLLSVARAVHRDRQPDADQSGGDLRPGRHGDPGQGLRRGAARSPTTRRSGSRPGSARARSSLLPTTSATPRRAW